MPCALPLAAYLAAQLILSELMIKPPSGGSEWIEIFNAGDAPIATTGLSIEDARGRPAKFPEQPAELAPGTYLVLASNVERVLEQFTDLDAARVVKPAGTWPAL
ncbi:MAG TPA: lamin tail domain-containing protein, partial [Candidatus Eisenbacteria bacterium]